MNGGLTAALGVVYWLVAARAFSQADVGRGSTLVAALWTVSGLAQLNYARSLSGLVPKAGSQVVNMLTRVYLRVGLASVVGGLAFAFLFRLAHEQGTLFGLLAVLVLVTTGLAVDLIGSWKATRSRHPAVVALKGFARGVRGDALLTARQRPRSAADVERLHEKYKTFRKLSQ